MGVGMGSVPRKVQQGQGPTEFHKQWTNFESVFHIYLYIKKVYESWTCAKEDQWHMEGGYKENIEKVWKQLLKSCKHAVS